jgi:formate/nitrite transporter
VAEAARFDAYAPAEVAARVEETGVRKAGLDLLSTLALACLAGAFVAFGAAFSTVAGVGSTWGYGATRVLVGGTFCLGLVLVVVAGAELFTGNNLIVMAWASGRVTTARLLRNWFWVYVGNFAGAAGVAAIYAWSGRWEDADGQVGAAAVRIARAKCALTFGEAFVLGVLCNVLVCLAVWLASSARSTSDRILAVVFPITAFVALGFEHSVANMYFLPLGLMLKSEPAVLSAGGWQGGDLAGLAWPAVARNLAAVTLGNIVGGGVLVAGVYWTVYLRAPADRGA